MSERKYLTQLLMAGDMNMKTPAVISAHKGSLGAT